MEIVRSPSPPPPPESLPDSAPGSPATVSSSSSPLQAAANSASPPTPLSGRRAGAVDGAAPAAVVAGALAWGKTRLPCFDYVSERRADLAGVALRTRLAVLAGGRRSSGTPAEYRRCVGGVRTRPRGLRLRGPRGGAAHFVDRFQRRVYGLALAIMRAPVDAEEVAQEAFVRAWQFAASFDDRRGRWRPGCSASPATWRSTAYGSRPASGTDGRSGPRAQRRPLDVAGAIEQRGRRPRGWQTWWQSHGLPARALWH